jgi:hypothetical protein
VKDMTKQPTEADVIYGRDSIAALLGIPPEYVTRLHLRGRLPVLRIDRGYIAKRAPLLAAKEEARRRGDAWAVARTRVCEVA